MKVLKSVRIWIKKAMPYLAWVSFVFALTGGALLPDTPPGKGIAHFVGSVTWWWLPILVFCGGIAGLVIDIVRDRIPDRIAVYAAALAPTVASAIGGKLAEKVRALADWVAGYTSGPLMDWSGIEAAGVPEAAAKGALAVLCIVLALVIAHRVMKDKRSGHAGMEA